MRAIDADALQKEYMHEHDGKRLMLIDVAPTIEPRKKGKWIEYDNSHCECPFCHEEWSYFDNETEYFNYCPNCGAEMLTEDKG